MLVGVHMSGVQSGGACTSGDGASAADRDADRLVVAASQARLLADAPSSGFAMGAAVETDSEHIVTGTIVESVHWAGRCSPNE